jgi:hypothetical protein
MTVSRKLTLDDIVDVRAYERERTAFCQAVIDLKRARRVEVGPIVTFVFENRDTVRFQIQEIARVERIATDADIQAQLDIYNSLIPEPGHLSATLFIELTTREAVEVWLTRLVGIERCVLLLLSGGVEVGSRPEAAHEARLTRQDVTSSVHYVQFALTSSEIQRFAGGPADLAIRHPAYEHTVTLGDETRTALLEDLRA